MSGQYLEIDVLTGPEGGEKTLRKKIEAGGRCWVESVDGQAYHIRLTNRSDKTIFCFVHVDGCVVGKKSLQPGQSRTVQDVAVEVKQEGGRIQEVRKELVFVKPKIFDEEAEGRPINAGAAAMEMGSIKVKVSLAGTCSTTHGPSTCFSGFSDSAIGHAAAQKKGAFKSASGLGSQAKLTEAGRINLWTLKEELETVELRYGSVALMLLAGVPAHHFMVKRSSGPAQTVDLTEEGDGGAAPQAQAHATAAAASAAAAAAGPAPPNPAPPSGAAPLIPVTPKPEPALKRLKPDPDGGATLDLTR